MLSLGQQLASELRTLSKQEKVSLYATLLATFNVLIHGYTGQRDIILGRGVTGRTSAAIEKLIGCFVNMVVMRNRVDGGRPFVNFLKETLAVAEAAYSNQDLPFGKLVTTLQCEPDSNCPPIVQIAFNLYTAPSFQEMATDRLDVFDLGEFKPPDMALFQDAIFGIHDTGNSLIAEMKYNRDLFDSTSVDNMLHDYKAVLETVSAHRDKPIIDLIGLANVAACASKAL